MIELVPIDASNWLDAVAVVVDNDQLRFVAGHQPIALLILAKAYLSAGGERQWSPCAFVVDGKVVGVVGLIIVDSVCEVFHLAIDRAQQRRGYGSAAVAAIVAYASVERGCHTATLTVHPDNAVAQRVYGKNGFVETGETRHGEPVWHCVLR